MTAGHDQWNGRLRCGFEFKCFECIPNLLTLAACPDFFFLAEDGIRDLTVTGVQTCALPICRDAAEESPPGELHPANRAMFLHRPRRRRRLAVVRPGDRRVPCRAFSMKMPRHGSLQKR